MQYFEYVIPKWKAISRISPDDLAEEINCGVWSDDIFHFLRRLMQRGVKQKVIQNRLLKIYVYDDRVGIVLLNSSVAVSPIFLDKKTDISDSIFIYTCIGNELESENFVRLFSIALGEEELIEEVF